MVKKENCLSHDALEDLGIQAQRAEEAGIIRFILWKINNAAMVVWSWIIAILILRSKK